MVPHSTLSDPESSTSDLGSPVMAAELESSVMDDLG
jgi:hypothetical protein